MSCVNGEIRKIYPRVKARASHIFSTKNYWPGPGCSKLTTSLVNVSLKFQTVISEIRQYFLLKNCEKLLHCKSFSHFFNKKYECNCL